MDERRRAVRTRSRTWQRLSPGHRWFNPPLVVLHAVALDYRLDKSLLLIKAFWTRERLSEELLIRAAESSIYTSSSPIMRCCLSTPASEGHGIDARRCFDAESANWKWLWQLRSRGWSDSLRGPWGFKTVESSNRLHTPLYLSFSPTRLLQLVVPERKNKSE